MLTHLLTFAHTHAHTLILIAHLLPLLNATRLEKTQIGTDYQNKYPGSLALCKKKLHIFVKEIL